MKYWIYEKYKILIFVWKKLFIKKKKIRCIVYVNPKLAEPIFVNKMEKYSIYYGNVKLANACFVKKRNNLTNWDEVKSEITNVLIFIQKNKLSIENDSTHRDSSKIGKRNARLVNTSWSKKSRRLAEKS